MILAPLAAMKDETMAYSEEKAAALCKLVPDLTQLHMRACHFAILFPQDVHAPCVEWNEPK
jgi:biofilm protein TabA